MPTRAWRLVAARLDQAADRRIAWSLHRRSPVGSERPGLYGPLGGVERPGRKVRFARLIHAARPRLLADLRSAPPAAAIRLPLVGTQHDRHDRAMHACQS
jgi:hypothetical protein